MKYSRINPIFYFLRTIFPNFMLLPLLFLFTATQAQNVSEDSVLFNQQIQDLINQKQYASAHILLEDFLQQSGLKPFYACWMVENGLLHYFRHENYHIFYLMDEPNHWNESTPDTTRNMRIARLRYPEHILKAIIHQHPGYARAYKLLGDYYNMQIQDMNALELPDTNRMNNLEKLVFQYYTQAEKLNYQDVQINQWLGIYYRRINQIDLAEKYFLRNIKPPHHDAISFLNLAEISYQRKKYASAFNYAIQAVKYFSPIEVYLKYDAKRLAARSLLALGDEERFLQYIEDCIQMLPDVQDAYIDLFQYYEGNGRGEEAEAVLKKMLLANPFDRKGYTVLENYIIKHQNYFFGERLFDEMLLKYENWDEVLANIYWSKGNLAFAQGLKSEAENFWEISRNYMRRYLPENSPLLKQVGDVARLSGKK